MSDGKQRRIGCAREFLYVVGESVEDRHMRRRKHAEDNIDKLLAWADSRGVECALWNAHRTADAHALTIAFRVKLRQDAASALWCPGLARVTFKASCRTRNAKAKRRRAQDWRQVIHVLEEWFAEFATVPRK